MTPLTSRGTIECRCCGNEGLVSVLDLGEQPLSNEMGRTADEVLPTFALHLRICPSCALGQVGEFVTPERIFGQDYPYLSSTSTGWVQHARRYADDMTATLQLGADDNVVEIASNDGYLLSGFLERGIPVLGIEPAANVARIAIASGVPTRVEFFNADTARTIVADVGHPRLVVANNVMAHVPDLMDFTAGLRELADESTVITVENPSLLNLLLERQFDTIYHEHYSYLSAHSVDVVTRQHDLELFRIEQLPTHGGSNRYWFARSNTREIEGSVGLVLAQELDGGLLDPQVWAAFGRDSRAAVDGLRSWLEERSADGRTLVAYGAAAKGNTILNAAGATREQLRYVVDSSMAKQGRFLPGSAVPVHPPEALEDDDPDDVLVLPWNLVDEIAPLIRARAPRATAWVAIPKMAAL